ncbi:hypothetical protein [Priestia megaterium]|uniref:hypothetical protein n=1 Tax=Priestia megaterium TaxID=1404 RepID=UPI002E1D2BC9|nr:hypothetical protein [Priestia megaterium]
MSFREEFTQKVQERFRKELKGKLALDTVQEEIREGLGILYADLQQYVDNGVGIDIDTTVYREGIFSRVTIAEDTLLFKREGKGINVFLNNEEIDLLWFNSVGVFSNHFDQKFSTPMLSEYLKQAFRKTLGL